MLTKIYRPKTFKEIKGQDIPKSILRETANNPVGKPKVFLLQGDFGTGKSTLARVFGRALNCSSTEKPCLVCDSCKVSDDVLEDHRYTEYDSAIIGNVKSLKELRETWYYSSFNGYKVIVFDECQTVSPQAQEALLKVTENPPDNVFFLFCTTEMEKMIKPLISRTFNLEFYPLTDGEIEELIQYISLKEGIEIDSDISIAIVKLSKGHARNAVMQLEKVRILGVEGFKSNLKFADKLLVKLFQLEDVNAAKDVIFEISKYPLYTLIFDVESFFKRLIERTCLDKIILWNKIDSKVALKMFQLFIGARPIIIKSTDNMVSFLYSLFSLVLSEKSSEKKDLNIDRYKKT